MTGLIIAAGIFCFMLGVIVGAVGMFAIIQWASEAHIRARAKGIQS